MKRKIITTKDGSKTIQIEAWNEQYHSIHGAINEANHVFIKHGLLHFFYKDTIPMLNDDAYFDGAGNLSKEAANILEIGFGTGLNAFLTALNAKALNLNINYVGVEAYPVQSNELEALNYVDLIDASQSELFDNIHQSKWGNQIAVTPNFILTKQKKFFEDISDKNCYDIIYFDAFGARVQPDLWSASIFRSMYDALKDNGVLVTYAAIGRVKRLMKDLGFAVERLDGPPGKRHMLRATKVKS
ncbi:MAG: tRNA (5-methylaminomethyl-2-thiouridine)(34)-methyltransferase MnmD [Flavobacteriaceae bacterium]|nr:tRNA (5-methylaminomethyl-2-thiouridine)(34)-methyltransferase MnmD [Flavobacteriaceae bacterium]